MLKRMLFLFFLLTSVFALSYDYSLQKPFYNDSKEIDAIITFNFYDLGFIEFKEPNNLEIFFNDKKYNINDNINYIKGVNNFQIHFVNTQVLSNFIIKYKINNTEEHTITIPSQSGAPYFESFLLNSESKDSISVYENESINISFVLRDNIDDFGGDFAFCELYINNVLDSSQTLSQKNGNYNFSFAVSSLKAGSYNAKVICYDNEKSNVYQSVEKVFSIEVLPIESVLYSVSINPESVKKDSLLQCNAEYNGKEVPSYEWYIDDKKIAEGPGYKCNPNICKENSKIFCRAILGESFLDSKKLFVASFFESLTISSNSSAEVNQPVNFSANLSYNGSSDLSYSWDFGDGSTANGKEVTHIYSEAGTYHVVLTVSDGHSSITAEKDVFINNPNYKLNFISDKKVSKESKKFWFNLEPDSNFELFIDGKKRDYGHLSRKYFFSISDLNAGKHKISIILPNKEKIESYFYIEEEEQTLIYHIITDRAKDPDFLLTGEKIKRVELCSTKDFKKVVLNIEDEEYSLKKNKDCYYKDLNYFVENDVLILKFVLDDKNISINMPVLENSNDYNISFIDLPEINLNKEYTLYFYSDADEVYYEGKKLEKNGPYYKIKFKAEYKQDLIILQLGKEKKPYFFKPEIKDKLLLKLINPKENGAYFSRHIILDISYLNSDVLDVNELRILLNGKESVFRKKNSLFVSEEKIPLFSIFNINIDLNYNGNTAHISKTLFLSPILDINTWIFVLLIIAGLLLMAFILIKIFRIRKDIKIKKRIKQLFLDLDVLASKEKALAKDYFQRKINEQNYKIEKNEIKEKKDSLIKNIFLLLPYDFEEKEEFIELYKSLSNMEKKYNKKELEKKLLEKGFSRNFVKSILYLLY